MAIIGIRELLRDNKKIIERVRDEQEAFLILKGKDPVAALVPVDPAHAERYLVAATPELAATFRDAARAAEAGEDVETVSIEELAAEHGDEDETLFAEPMPAWKTALLGDAQRLFGPALAERFATAAASNLHRITLGAAQAVAESERRAATPRIGELNVELFRSALPGVVSTTVAERVSHIADPEGDPQGLLGQGLVEEALARTSEKVDLINRALVSRKSGLSLDEVELTLQTSIDTLGLTKMTRYGAMKMIDFGETTYDFGSFDVGERGKFSVDE
jgi:antitoxin (DNA-binding transcriptional repressor) of toxin-antitoxin stability system